MTLEGKVGRSRHGALNAGLGVGKLSCERWGPQGLGFPHIPFPPKAATHEPLHDVE